MYQCNCRPAPAKKSVATTETTPVQGVLFSPALKYDGDGKHEGHEHPDHHHHGTEELVYEEDHMEDYADEDEEDDEDIFNPYLFIAGLPPHSTVVIRDKICLPPLPGKGPQTRPTLALDLDETLVHCTVEPIPKPDLTFPVTFNGTFYQVYVRKRPYLDYFLESVAKNFEVVVFTASQKVYADVLLDLLDPERKFIEHRLFREACLFVQGNYLKDLTVLGRDMKKVGWSE
jgi:CTD small phosphatase-like protein 2